MARVPAVAWVQFLDQELPHAVGVTKKKKKKQNKKQKQTNKKNSRGGSNADFIILFYAF